MRSEPSSRNSHSSLLGACFAATGKPRMQNGCKPKAAMAQPPLEPISVFLAAFGTSSFAGLAALLRSGKQLSKMAIASAMLNAGLLGLVIAMVWWHQFSGSEENIYWLIGLCILSGLGGMTVIDFALQLLKKGGVNITFKPVDDDKPDK